MTAANAERTALLTVGDGQPHRRGRGSGFANGSLDPSSRNLGTTYTASSLCRSPSSLGAALVQSGWSPTPGIPVMFRDVSVVEGAPACCEKLQTLITGRRRGVLVRYATGLFSPGGLHVIASLDRLSGTALLESLIGRRSTASGQIWFGSHTFRPSSMQHLIGVVWEHTWTFSELTVETNLYFACQMQMPLQSTTPEVISGRIAAVLDMLRLSADWKVSNLTKYQRLRLDLGMELVADPPILVVGDLLECLDVHETIDCMDLLSFLARGLSKTIVLSTAAIPVALFQKAATISVLGDDGHMLFSGTAGDAAEFFSRIQLTQLASDRHLGRGAGGATHRYAMSYHGSSPPAAATTGHQHHHHMPTGEVVNDSAQGMPPVGVASSLPKPDSTRSVGSAASMATIPASALTGGRIDDGDTSMHEGDTLFLSAADTRSSLPTRPEDIDGSAIMDFVERLATDSTRTAEVASIFYDGEYRRKLVAEQQLLLTVTETALVAQGSPSPVGSPPVVSPSPLNHRHLGATSHHMPAPPGMTANDAIALRQHTAELIASVPPSRPVTQFLLLCKMLLSQGARQVEFYIIWALLFLVLGLCTYLLSAQPSDQTGVQNLSGIVFLLFYMSIAVNGLFIDQWYREIRRYVHMRARGLTHPVSHLVMLLGQLGLQRALYLATFTLFVYVALGKKTTETSSLLGLTSYVHALVVYALVMFLRSSRMTTAFVYVLDGYFMVFCGFLINITTVGPFFSKTSLVRVGYGAVLHHSLHGGNFSCAVPAELNVTSPCYTGDAYLQLNGFQGDSTETATWILLVVGAIAMTVCLLRMWWL